MKEDLSFDEFVEKMLDPFAERQRGYGLTDSEINILEIISNTPQEEGNYERMLEGADHAVTDFRVMLLEFTLLHRKVEEVKC